MVCSVQRCQFTSSDGWKFTKRTDRENTRRVHICEFNHYCECIVEEHNSNSVPKQLQQKKERFLAHGVGHSVWRLVVHRVAGGTGIVADSATGIIAFPFQVDYDPDCPPDKQQ